MNGDLTINDEEEQGTVTVQTNSPLYSSQDSFTPILRLLVQHSHNNEWLQVRSIENQLLFYNNYILIIFRLV